MTATHLPFPVGSGARVPVLLDIDISSNVDDLLAVLFILDDIRLDLVGEITVYGVHKLRARVAKSTLEVAWRADISAGYGIWTPLSVKPIF